MYLKLFDIEQNLHENPDTKDLADIYNADAVNQSIDIFITNPYRIGLGLTNRIFTTLFSDMTPDGDSTLSSIIQDEFRKNYPLLEIQQLVVTPFPNERRYKVHLEWKISQFSMSGTYVRYWSTKG